MATKSKTSRDVAAALGISQATVSRAFTPGASVSPALRARIHAAASEMGYRPNFLARSLVAGQSRLIGAVIAPQTNLLHPNLLYELTRRFAEEDYELLLLSAADESGVPHALQQLGAYRVEAVLATGILDEATAGAVVAQGMPLVTFNRLLPDISGVSCDFAAGAAVLVDRLIAAGHARFGLVAGPPTSWVSAEVARGVRDALVACPGTSLRIASVAFDYGRAADALAILADQPSGLPTAILCVNDTVAAGCLDHLRTTLGRSVPDDVALVTFPGDGPAAWDSYRLSGVRPPIQRMIAATIDLLKQARASDRRPEHRIFHADLVAGATANLGDPQAVRAHPAA